MTKTLSVTAIKNGSVIDHISQGQAVRIIRLLHLDNNKNQMTVGLNLKSKSMGLKDLIKVESRQLTDYEAEQVAVLAPNATINIIDNFKISKKINVKLPEIIQGLLICPNSGCITHHEPIESFFYLSPSKNTLKLQCKYCEKAFSRDEIKEYTA